MRQRDISLIVCTTDAGRLSMLGEALARQAGLPDSGVELVVVLSGAGGANKDLPAAVQRLEESDRWDVQRAFCAKPGLARARNAGISASHSASKVLAWTDDDTDPQPEWLSRLYEPLSSDDATVRRFDAVCGRVEIAPHLLRDWMQTTHRRRLAEAITPEPGMLVGANMAFRREVLKRVPGFDERLGAGEAGFQEDSLFGNQLEQAGYRLGFVEDACVTHHFDPSRLRRSAWLDSAKKLGRSTAYVSRHWLRAKPSWTRLKLFRKKLQLAWWRLFHLSGSRPDQEGITADELGLVQFEAYYEALLREWRRPARYGDPSRPADSGGLAAIDRS